MVLATIDLEAPEGEVERATLWARFKAEVAMELARGLFREVFLGAGEPGEHTHPDGRGKSLWVMGREVFRLRHDVFPEKVVIHAEWLIDAEDSARFGEDWGSSWEVRL